MHKIVVLDGQTVNPGDLDWSWLGKYGEYQVYPRTPEDLIRQRIGDADIILTNKTVLTRDILAAHPGIRYVGLLSTGLNSVDLDTARSMGIAVTSVPEYATQAVAQLTFALLLELCNHVGMHAEDVAAGSWVESPDFCYWLTPQVELYGLTAGIVGMGRIGRAVCRIAGAFGMNVLYTSHTEDMEVKARFMSLEELLPECDVVTLHCPLTDETAGMVNAEFLSRMKPGAILINTARGGLVDEQAVADALRSGQLGGFGADVSASEPMSPGSPLLNAPNCVITPHIAWASLAARSRLMDTAESNLDAWSRQEKKNRIV